VRKLPFPKLFTFVISIVGTSKHHSIDSKIGHFFRNGCNLGLLDNTEPAHRSAITKARSKISWKLFEEIFHNAVKLAYETWPDESMYTWHGKNVFAIDGSKYDLPATDQIRDEFDPKSGLAFGKGHYPQCLVSTAYDVFRRIPIAQTISPKSSSERDEALKMLDFLPSSGILLFDRGYPGFGFIRELILEYDGYFLMRCKANSTFPAIEKFIKNGKKDAQIVIDPSEDFLKENPHLKNSVLPIKVRCIKMISPDGTISVLLTNICEWKQFTSQELIDLYYKRWAVEVGYRDQKETCQIEKFHSRTPNGIRQELFAILILIVISRLVIARSGSRETEKHFVEPQFKNAIVTMASAAAVLVSTDPEKSAALFSKIITKIKAIKYYRPKKPKPTQPRINRGPKNKWQKFRSQIMKSLKEKENP